MYLIINVIETSEAFVVFLGFVCTLPRAFWSEPYVDHDVIKTVFFARFYCLAQFCDDELN